MRLLVQRAHWAEVEVDGAVVGRIEQGLLVYLGIGIEDTDAQVRKLADKTTHLRIFQDPRGKMNRSVQDVRGGILAVPNFTLLADASKGRRPAFTAAAPPSAARALFEAYLQALEDLGCQVAAGVFGAEMTVRSAAAGPVNIIVDL